MATELINLPNKGHRSLDVAKAFKLKMSGLTYEEVGNALGGYSKSSVFEALQNFRHLLDNPESVKVFREHEAELLDSVRSRLLRLIAERLPNKKNSAYQLAGMYGLIYDKTRLERGQSTENIANLTAIIQAVHSNKRKGNGIQEIEVARGDTLEGVAAGSEPESG